MKIDTIRAGLLDYIDAEIIAKAQGWHKFAISAAVILGMPRIDETLTGYTKTAAELGVVNASGDIDTNKLHEALKQAIAKSGSFEWQGMIFGADDIEKLFYYVSKQEARG